MNDCLLESENFQITKSDNNKYLLLPVKKQQPEKFMLKECGKDFDNRNLLSLTHTHTPTHLISFFENKIRKKTRNYLSPHPPSIHTHTHTHLSVHVICWHCAARDHCRWRVRLCPFTSPLCSPSKNKKRFFGPWVGCAGGWHAGSSNELRDFFKKGVSKSFELPRLLNHRGTLSGIIFTFMVLIIVS